MSAFICLLFIHSNCFASAFARSPGGGRFFFLLSAHYFAFVWARVRSPQRTRYSRFRIGTQFASALTNRRILEIIISIVFVGTKRAHRLAPAKCIRIVRHLSSAQHMVGRCARERLLSLIRCSVIWRGQVLKILTTNGNGEMSDCMLI